MYAIMYGNPVDGFGLLGPFTDSEDAINYAEERRETEWWLMALEAPVELRAPTKSQMVAHIAAELGVPFIDIKLAEVEPLDIMGIPNVSK